MSAVILYLLVLSCHNTCCIASFFNVYSSYEIWRSWKMSCSTCTLENDVLCVTCISIKVLSCGIIDMWPPMILFQCFAMTCHPGTPIVCTQTMVHQLYCMVSSFMLIPLFWKNVILEFVLESHLADLYSYTLKSDFVWFYVTGTNKFIWSTWDKTAWHRHGMIAKRLYEYIIRRKLNIYY